MIIKKDLARITVDLPVNLQKKLKAVAAIQGKSMRTVIIESIQKELNIVEKTTQASLKNIGL